MLEMASTSGKTSRCKLHEVLYMPGLSYNFILLSISKAVEAGKVVEFVEVSCRILDANRKLITAPMRVANLYYLNCLTDRQQAMHLTNKTNRQSKTSGIGVMVMCECKTFESWPRRSWLMVLITIYCE